jgi:hypothetical protein
LKKFFRIKSVADNSITCKNCRFSYTSVWGTFYCRKNAPTSSTPKFPHIQLDDWCGEFKRKFVHEEENRKLQPGARNFGATLTKCCGNCEHFRIEEEVPMEDIEHGLCTRNTPSVMGVTDIVATSFPKVNKLSCCSKFRSRNIFVEEENENPLTPGKRAIRLD